MGSMAATLQNQASTSPKVLGPFRIDHLGLLRPASPQATPGFSVHWRNRAVHAHLAEATQTPGQETDGEGSIALSARLGRVPSTARATPASGQRRSILQVLRQLPALMPDGWRLHLQADHCVTVEASARIALPMSAVALVTDMANFLLRLTPYLELLDADGLGADGLGADGLAADGLGAAAGTEKI